MGVAGVGLGTRLIYIYMYCIERSVNIIITRITRVNNIMLLLAISLHMLTFRGLPWLLGFAY